jgi:uncharacterized repeat protein (TIGR04138 family)
MREDLETIARDDGRYSPQALRFVYEGLSRSKSQKKSSQTPIHISGQTLCEDLKVLAVEKWGRLAMLVLNTWGIRTTRDFGEIVFLMIKHKWMSAGPGDSIEDFDSIYDFKVVFKDRFEF